MTFVVVTHAGTGSKPDQRDGTDQAARRSMDALRAGRALLDAVCEAPVSLEDDPRSNAGTGSSLRFDGHTLEMAAALMDSSGRFGAVSAIREVKGPILVARDVMETPHPILSGEGAIRYARRKGHPMYDPWTRRAMEKFEKIISAVCTGKYERSDCEWALGPLREHWNDAVPFEAIVETRDNDEPDGGDTGDRQGTCDTVGAGIYAGRHGAVACTGNGDHILRELLAHRVHGWLAEGVSPTDALGRVAKTFPEHVDCNVIIVREAEHAAGGNRDMAWSVLQEV